MSQHDLTRRRKSGESNAMTSMRELSDRHIEAYQTVRYRSLEGEALRQAEKAMHQAMEAICTYPCTSEDDAWHLYEHLHWYEWVTAGQMEPHAKALFAAMRHTPGKNLLPPPAANDRRLA